MPLLLDRPFLVVLQEVFVRTDRSFQSFTFPASRYQIHARRKLGAEWRPAQGICLAVVLGLAVYSLMGLVVWWVTR
jgi:hypothetical protein